MNHHVCVKLHFTLYAVSFTFIFISHKRREHLGGFAPKPPFRGSAPKTPAGGFAPRPPTGATPQAPISPNYSIFNYSLKKYVAICRNINAPFSQDQLPVLLFSRPHSSGPLSHGLSSLFFSTYKLIVNAIFFMLVGH